LALVSIVIGTSISLSLARINKGSEILLILWVIAS
jgi:hypothetical protein